MWIREGNEVSCRTELAVTTAGGALLKEGAGCGWLVEKAASGFRGFNTQTMIQS